MSRILVVGNILKDVYLNLDTRTSDFETDANGVKWLDLSFDASKHEFFSRTSTFGGATISLEVLKKMGHEASISGSKIDFDEDGITGTEFADEYRYIMVTDEQTCYFSPSYQHATEFIAPKNEVDFIFVDRSANMIRNNDLLRYLDEHPKTKLVFYVRKKERNTSDNDLIMRANLVFSEKRLKNVVGERLVLIQNNQVLYLGETMNFSTQRVDLATHLSTYSILAATMLGAIALGRKPKECLRLAKANIENSSLDETLSMSRMEEIAL